MLGSDTRRRLQVLETRIDWLDQHGTRGVDSIRVQLVEQAKDIGALGQQIAEVGVKVSQADGARWQRFTAYAIAILPVYVLLILAIIKAKG